MDSRNKTLLTLARVLMAIIFIVAGTRKVMGYAGTVKYFGALGLPMPEIVTPLVILIELGGGLLLLFGVRTQIVASILALFTLGTALIGHQFWAADAAQFSGQLNNFMKNVAMVGGFLALIGFERNRSGRG